MNKILSVSIAAYNIEQYLPKALESCLSPELFDKLEVIIVNDGSSDGTLQIANIYSTKYPNVFKVIDKNNGGYGSTVNASIRVATGKYFRLLDGDDWFNKEELIDFVHTLEYSEEDMIVSRFQRVFEENGHVEVRDETCGTMYKTLHFEEIDTEDWFTMHAITYKTSVLKNNNITLTEHCFYTDQEYDLLPLRWVDTVKFVPQLLYCYRIGREGQSVSTIGVEKHYKEQTVVLKKLYYVFSHELDNPATKKDLYILKYLGRRTSLQIWNYILISKSKEHKKELMEFLSYLKNSQLAIYREIKKYKVAKAIIYSHGILYSALHTYKRIKYQY